jgi:hypothetical protein
MSAAISITGPMVAGPAKGARYICRGTAIIGAIYAHRRTSRKVVPTVQGNWMVAWSSGRVDWHDTLQEARDNALKGN